MKTKLTLILNLNPQISDSKRNHLTLIQGGNQKLQENIFCLKSVERTSYRVNPNSNNQINPKLTQQSNSSPNYQQIFSYDNRHNYLYCVFYDDTNRKSMNWFKNGIHHREDGPAIEYIDGSSQWYSNGILHREDGPAIENTSGNDQYFIYGREISKTQFKLKKFIKCVFQAA